MAGDYAIIWHPEAPDPCVLCGKAITPGAIGWYDGPPKGPVCDDCLLDGERLLGEHLLQVRAVNAGPAN